MKWINKKALLRRASFYLLVAAIKPSGLVALLANKKGFAFGKPFC
jgi:hypothetical protein